MTSEKNKTTMYGTTRVSRTWLLNGEHWFTRWNMSGGVVVEYDGMAHAWRLLSSNHASRSEPLPKEVAFYLLSIGLRAGKGN